MSTYMGRELELLVQSMICGALLVLVYDVNITVRQSRQSGVARATCPD